MVLSFYPPFSMVVSDCYAASRLLRFLLARDLLPLFIPDECLLLL